MSCGLLNRAICNDFNDPESHSAVARLTKGIHGAFVQHFTQFKLTQCVAQSLGDSLALVHYRLGNLFFVALTSCCTKSYSKVYTSC